MSIVLAGPVAYLSGSKSAVSFSPSPASEGAAQGNTSGTALPIRKLQNLLNIAYWGEDNRFPQNIENQLAFYGIGKEALNRKASWIFGGGLVPGTITGYNEDGSEIFQPLDRTKYKQVYDFIEARWFYRFMIEYLQDWAWFGNCFPEIIYSNDCNTIAKLVHQESCDCRFVQQSDKGFSETVYLSKLWGLSTDQYVKFDPTKAIPGLLMNPSVPALIEKNFIKERPCIDMYDALESAKAIAETYKSKIGLKSAILPVNYPSPNKTYYQLPAWDGARLAGWVEIASKIPSILKSLFTKAFSLKYHIEVPETYFEDKYGFEVWHGYTDDQRMQAKKTLLQQMEDFLTGDPNAYKSFISFFKIDPIGKKDFAQIKITAIADVTTIDKEIVTSSAADIQFLISAGIHPTLFGAGTIGTGQQRSGGSDIRESWIIYNAGLNLERQVVLEPLYLVRDFNGWQPDIVFRFRDTILTTLDKVPPAQRQTDPQAGSNKKVG